MKTTAAFLSLVIFFSPTGLFLPLFATYANAATEGPTVCYSDGHCETVISPDSSTSTPTTGTPTTRSVQGNVPSNLLTRIPSIPNVPNSGTGASVIGSAVAGGITAGVSAYALQSLLSTVDPTAVAQCVGELAGTPCVTTSFFGMYLAYGVCNGVGTCVAKGVTPLGTGLLSAGIGVVSGAIQLGMRAITGGGSTGGVVIPSTSGTVSSRCTYRYQVTTPSSDPCAIYVPPTSSSLINKTTSSQLLNSLRAPNVSDSLLIQASNVTAPSASPVQAPAQALTFVAQSGDRGGIQLTSTSATIQAGVRNAGLNTETAGFFGSNASQGSPPQNIIERICLVRPWQSPLIAAGISNALFDNLCLSKSLQVGVSPSAASPTPKATTPAAAPAAKPAAQTQPTGPYVAPQVSIWASPASVPVGSRTSIFWTAKGVDSCLETSPDGSFNGTSLYGSAATVPLSAATVFTISCVAPDGSHVTDSVTVNLAI